MSEAAYLRLTRSAYDVVAVDYARLLSAALADKPSDRAVLATFAELVLADRLGPVADVGCGSGRITRHLHRLGLDVFGFDLSPGMVAVARKAHPDLHFVEASMTALDVAGEARGGIVAWYSLIHIPPEHVPEVLAELHRALAPGGHLLLAFQVGDERRHLEEAYGHKISLDAYRLLPDRVAEQLSAVGLTVHARLVRDPDETEKVPQAYLMARKAPRGRS